MKCPMCHDRTHVEIDLHGEGFSGGIIKECGSCGAVWSKTSNNISLIFSPKSESIEELVCEQFTHTKYSSFCDEYVAEDEMVWFS